MFVTMSRPREFRYACPVCLKAFGITSHTHKASFCPHKATALACNYCAGPHKITECPSWKPRQKKPFCDKCHRNNHATVDCRAKACQHCLSFRCHDATTCEHRVEMRSVSENVAATRDATWDREQTWEPTWGATWEPTRDATWEPRWEREPMWEREPRWERQREPEPEPRWEREREREPEREPRWERQREREPRWERQREPEPEREPRWEREREPEREPRWEREREREPRWERERFVSFEQKRKREPSSEVDF